jgi:hypothetical protein
MYKSVIIAQVAITALSLPRLNLTHWTAQASFRLSLVTGCLSVSIICHSKKYEQSIQSTLKLRNGYRDQSKDSEEAEKIAFRNW